jgi:hypothetical protein
MLGISEIGSGPSVSVVGDAFAALFAFRKSIFSTVDMLRKSTVASAGSSRETVGVSADADSNVDDINRRECELKPKGVRESGFGEEPRGCGRVKEEATGDTPGIPRGCRLFLEMFEESTRSIGIIYTVYREGT